MNSMQKIKGWVMGCLAALTLSLTAGCGGGGGGGLTPPTPATQLRGQVLSIQGVALGRAASATLTYSAHVPVTTGTMQLMLVTTSGAPEADARFPIPVTVDAQGNFSVTTPEGTFGASRVILSHSSGLKAVVTEATGLRVDPVSTLVFQKSVAAGFSGITQASLKLSQDAIRTAWAATPITVQGNSLGDLTTVIAGLNNLVVTQNITLPSATAFCGDGARAFVIATDYRVGALADACYANGALTVRPFLSGTHSDAVVRSSGNKIYVVNRYGGDNLQVLDKTTLRVLNQVSFKATQSETPNPQNIEVVNDNKAFVTLYGRNKLLVMDPTKTTYAEARLNELDLAPYMDGRDTDGSPEASGMVMSGTRIYVGLQRLKTADFSYDPASGSVIVVVDTAANGSIVGSIELPGTNCSPSHVDAASNQLFVACNGDYFNSDFTEAANLATDGLIVVNLTTNAATFVLSNAQAQMKMGGFYFVSATQGFVSLYNATTFANTIRLINPTTGVMGTEVFSGTISGAAVDSAGRLWIGSRKTGATGLVIVNQQGQTVVQATSAGLPPGSLGF